MDIEVSPEVMENLCRTAALFVASHLNCFMRLQREKGLPEYQAITDQQQDATLAALICAVYKKLAAEPTEVVWLKVGRDPLASSLKAAGLDPKLNCGLVSDDGAVKLSISVHPGQVRVWKGNEPQKPPVLDMVILLPDELNGAERGKQLDWLILNNSKYGRDHRLESFLQEKLSLDRQQLQAPVEAMAKTLLDLAVNARIQDQDFVTAKSFLEQSINLQQAAYYRGSMRHLTLEELVQIADALRDSQMKVDYLNDILTLCEMRVDCGFHSKGSICVALANTYTRWQKKVTNSYGVTTVVDRPRIKDAEYYFGRGIEELTGEGKWRQIYLAYLCWSRLLDRLGQEERASQMRLQSRQAFRKWREGLGLE